MNGLSKVATVRTPVRTRKKELLQWRCESERQLTEFKRAAFWASKANEKLASLTSPVSDEGRTARRLAMQMSVHSDNVHRMVYLAKKYSSEKGADILALFSNLC